MMTDDERFEKIMAAVMAVFDAGGEIEPGNWGVRFDFGSGGFMFAGARVPCCCPLGALLVKEAERGDRVGMAGPAPLLNRTAAALLETSPYWIGGFLLYFDDGGEPPLPLDEFRQGMAVGARVAAAVALLRRDR